MPAFSKLSAVVDADQSNPEWSRTREVARAHLGRELLRQHRPVEAFEKIDEATSKLGLLLSKNSASRETRVQLARTFLLAADVQRAQGNGDAAVTTCKRASTVLAGLVPGSTDFRTLDPWIRANYCMGNAALVAPQKHQLEQMHYFDSNYLNSFTANP